MRTMSNKKTKLLLSLEAKQMRKNEVFLGNTKVDELPKKIAELKPLKTLRIGQQSFDITALPLNRTKYRPLFLNVAELVAYDKIMTKKNN